MIAPIIPINEQLRQLAVEKYNLLDTAPEESYDNITSLMQYVCDVPISLITLLDRERNYLKSHQGIELSESPREISFCGHAINNEHPITIIPDTRIDERFHDNPLVSEHQAIFYAGVPLVNPEGFKLGTLCVYDHKPRELNDQQLEALQNMAKQVVRLFEERLQNNKLRQLQKKLKERNRNLEKFAAIVSHDLKSPLAQITALTSLIESDHGGSLNSETLQYLEYIKSSSSSLRDYIDGILKFYKSDELIKQKASSINVSEFIKELKQLFKGDTQLNIEWKSKVKSMHVNKAALQQILVNLISNAIKYNDNETIEISIKLWEKESFYHFSVKDNGRGIPNDQLKSIFDLFTTLSRQDRFGNSGTGIGLATVKKVLSLLKGKIKVRSEVGQGSKFEFYIPK